MKRFLLFCLIVLSQCAWEWPSGWDLSYIKPSAIIYPGSVATTNVTLTAANSGQTIIFNNSTGVAANGTQFTLPSATLGVDIQIVADTAKWIYVQPQSGDIINLVSAVTGQRINNRTTAAVGDSIGLICFTAGQWSVYGRQGTWAAGN